MTTPKMQDPLREKVEFKTAHSHIVCHVCRKMLKVYKPLALRSMFRNGTCEHWYERAEDLPEI